MFSVFLYYQLKYIYKKRYNYTNSWFGVWFIINVESSAGRVKSSNEMRKFYEPCMYQTNQLHSEMHCDQTKLFVIGSTQQLECNENIIHQSWHIVFGPDSCDKLECVQLCMCLHILVNLVCAGLLCQSVSLMSFTVSGFLNMLLCT